MDLTKFVRFRSRLNRSLGPDLEMNAGSGAPGSIEGHAQVKQNEMFDHRTQVLLRVQVDGWNAQGLQAYSRTQVK